MCCESTWFALVKLCQKLCVVSAAWCFISDVGLADSSDSAVEQLLRLNRFGECCLFLRTCAGGEGVGLWRQLGCFRELVANLLLFIQPLAVALTSDASSCIGVKHGQFTADSHALPYLSKTMPSTHQRNNFKGVKMGKALLPECSFISLDDTRCSFFNSFNTLIEIYRFSTVRARHCPK